MDDKLQVAPWVKEPDTEARNRQHFSASASMPSSNVIAFSHERRGDQTDRLLNHRRTLRRGRLDDGPEAA